MCDLLTVTTASWLSWSNEICSTHLLWYPHPFVSFHVMAFRHVDPLLMSVLGWLVCVLLHKSFCLCSRQDLSYGRRGRVSPLWPSEGVGGHEK